VPSNPPQSQTNGRAKSKLQPTYSTGRMPRLH
jgi:hypothetical protein